MKLTFKVFYPINLKESIQNLKKIFSGVIVSAHFSSTNGTCELSLSKEMDIELLKRFFYQFISYIFNGTLCIDQCKLIDGTKEQREAVFEVFERKCVLPLFSDLPEDAVRVSRLQDRIERFTRSPIKFSFLYFDEWQLSAFLTSVPQTIIFNVIREPKRYTLFFKQDGSPEDLKKYFLSFLQFVKEGYLRIAECYLFKGGTRAQRNSVFQAFEAVQIVDLRSELEGEAERVAALTAVVAQEKQKTLKFGFYSFDNKYFAGYLYTLFKLPAVLNWRIDYNCSVTLHNDPEKLREFFTFFVTGINSGNLCVGECKLKEGGADENRKAIFGIFQEARVLLSSEIDREANAVKELTTAIEQQDANGMQFSFRVNNAKNLDILLRELIAVGLINRYVLSRNDRFCTIFFLRDIDLERLRTFFDRFIAGIISGDLCLSMCTLDRGGTPEQRAAIYAAFESAAKIPLTVVASVEERERTEGRIAKKVSKVAGVERDLHEKSIRQWFKEGRPALAASSKPTTLTALIDSLYKEIWHMEEQFKYAPSSIDDEFKRGRERDAVVSELRKKHAQSKQEITDLFASKSTSEEKQDLIIGWCQTQLEQIESIRTYLLNCVSGASNLLQLFKLYQYQEIVGRIEFGLGCLLELKIDAEILQSLKHELRQLVEIPLAIARPKVMLELAAASYTEEESLSKEALNISVAIERVIFGLRNRFKSEILNKFWLIDQIKSSVLREAIIDFLEKNPDRAHILSKDLVDSINAYLISSSTIDDLCNTLQSEVFGLSFQVSRDRIRLELFTNEYVPSVDKWCDDKRKRLEVIIEGLRSLNGRYANLLQTTNEGPIFPAASLGSWDAFRCFQLLEEVETINFGISLFPGISPASLDHLRKNLEDVRFCKLREDVGKIKDFLFVQNSFLVQKFFLIAQIKSQILQGIIIDHAVQGSSFDVSHFEEFEVKEINACLNNTEVAAPAGFFAKIFGKQAPNISDLPRVLQKIFRCSILTAEDLPAIVAEMKLRGESQPMMVLPAAVDESDEGDEAAAGPSGVDEPAKIEMLEGMQLQLAIQLSLLAIAEHEEPRELFGLQVYDVHYLPGDCLFEAIAASDAEGRDGVVIRALAVEQIRHDAQLQGRIMELVGVPEHRLFVNEGDGVFANVEDYLRFISLPQTWGTEIELVALARTLRRPIVVLTSGNRGDLIFEGVDYDMAHPIFLNYARGNHYTPLMITEGHEAVEVLAAIRARIEARVIAPVVPAAASAEVSVKEGEKKVKSEVAEKPEPEKLEAERRAKEDQEQMAREIAEKQRLEQGRELALARQRELEAQAKEAAEKLRLQEERERAEREAAAKAAQEAAEKAAAVKREKERYLQLAADSGEIPPSLRCPINHTVMRDPVMTAAGQVYERTAIQRWFDAGHSIDPLTGTALISFQLVPIRVLKNSIDEWLETMAQKLAAADKAKKAPVGDRAKFFSSSPRDPDRGGPAGDSVPGP